MPSARKLTNTLLCCVIVLNGCATIDSGSPVVFEDLQSYLVDEAFPEPGKGFSIEPPPDFLVLPDHYRKLLDLHIAQIESEYDRYMALRRWTFNVFSDFEYTSIETLSLSELNTNRKYNCLTFASLFVAAARYVNVPADFQLVYTPPYWDRVNDSWINNQHINVSGTVRLASTIDVEVSASFDVSFLSVSAVRPKLDYIADINPAVTSMRARGRVIDDQRVLSLFYSNRSMEMLLAHRLGAAYAYTRKALETDPASAVAWNNLGVLYNRVNEPHRAEQAFKLAIASDDRAFSAKSNLASAYRRHGQIASAIALERQVENFRAQNPYYHAALAEEDFDEGNWESAREHLLDALERKHNEQEFYHRLAIIALELGNYDAVLNYLDEAKRYARGSDKARFAGKIAALQNLL